MIVSRRSFIRMGLPVSLVGCALKTNRTPSADAQFEEWVRENHLVAASPDEANNARSSEVPCSKGLCRLPGGLTLRFHCGELNPLGNGRYNSFGLFDLGGNVSEGVFQSKMAPDVILTPSLQSMSVPPLFMRGASFLHSNREMLLSSQRIESVSGWGGEPDHSFRIVMSLE